MSECLGSVCKYYEDGCNYMYMGSGHPQYAPCHENIERGSWRQMMINPNMLKCTCCNNAINRNLVFDEHNEQQYVHCPFCGASLEKIELLNDDLLRIANQHYPKESKVSNVRYMQSENVVVISET